jgi:hypothetical protein
MGASRVRLYRFADLSEGVVVRHIGKDASVLYEFKKPVNIKDVE